MRKDCQDSEDLVEDNTVQSFSRMQVCPISFQKYYINVHISIGVHIFSLIALIDTGSDINILKKEKIPGYLWETSYGCVTGLGNNSLNLKYEVSKAAILMGNYEIGMKFYIADAPVDCILGTPFLSTVTPHGSCTVKGKSGYFITIPALNDCPCQRIELPFISEEFWAEPKDICMMRILHGKYFLDLGIPDGILEVLNRMELGLPGFSRNTHPTVIPPQHILGQICQQWSAQAEKSSLILEISADSELLKKQWYDHTIRAHGAVLLYIIHFK
jgi:hypothetical protein